MLTNPSPFVNAVNRLVSKGTTFARLRLGALSLIRSRISAGERIVRRIDIDKETDLKLGKLALEKGLMVDEMYRVILWAALEELQTPVSTT